MTVIYHKLSGVLAQLRRQCRAGRTACLLESMSVACSTWYAATDLATELSPFPSDRRIKAAPAHLEQPTATIYVPAPGLG